MPPTLPLIATADFTDGQAFRAAGEYFEAAVPRALELLGARMAVLAPVVRLKPGRYHRRDLRAQP